MSTNEENQAASAVSTLIKSAIDSRASDIHLDPWEGSLGSARIRIDGVLREVPLPEGCTFAELVLRLKSMAGLDLEEHLLPQDGRIMLEVSGHRIDIRVSTVPVCFGERLVMRLLDRKAVMVDLDTVVTNEKTRAQIRELCHLPCGLVLATGPTGSGKTTLLYAMVRHVVRPEINVMSVEDPIEFIIPGVAQTPVHAAKGMTFPRVIRSFLRQDPDVILVGEIRDGDTLRLCAQAALTGHLILSALHTNSADSAVQRLIDIGLEPFLVNSVLSGVVAQRLVRRLCPECKRPSEKPASTLPINPDGLPGALAQGTFCEPVGCDTCHGGFKGRVAIHEVLVMNDAIRIAVQERSGGEAIRAAARASGMKTLFEAGMELAAQGMTSINEVLRVVPLDAIQ